MVLTLFIISNSDGDVSISPKTEEVFLRELDAGDYGDGPIFLTSLDQEDPNYWPEGAILVLRGELIVPAAFDKVKHWGLPK